MLKLSYETRIGILAIVALLLGIWGYNFLKGINLISRSQVFYVNYDFVEQLQPSSPVFLKGLQVGTVKKIYQDPENGLNIIAELDIKNDVMVPKSAFATITSPSALGGKAVELEFTTPCTGDDCAQSGDYLQGRHKSLLESLIGDPAQIDVYTKRLQLGLTAVYDSIADPNDPQGFGRTLVSLQTSLVNIAVMTEKINRMLDASTSGISRSVNNVADLTGSLKNSQQSIINALNNLDTLTRQVKNAHLEKSAEKANVALDSVTASLSALRGTLVTTSKALKKVDDLAGKLTTGEGTAGKFLTDPELFDNLVRDTRHLHLLLQDLRLNPKRYNTVKLKVFGKNKTPNYNNPADDPAYQLLIDSLEREYSRKN